MTLAALSLFAMPQADAAPNRCATDLNPRQERRLDRFADELQGAGSVEEARDLARKKMAPASRILRSAERLAPNDQGLADARAKLTTFEANVQRARTPREVAEALPVVRTAAGCDMTTGEVIATVLGFILGILPGVILLILLC